MQRDALEGAIEAALRPGQFIDWRMESTFTSDLHAIAAQIDRLVLTDPERAVRIYESFLAGCYEKAEEIDDDGYFGIFIDGLYCGWVKARQAAGADPDKTAGLLLDRMENDPYGYATDLERETLKVMNTESLAAFERAVKILFDAEAGTDQTRHRWGEVLRAIYGQQQNADAYVAVCRQTALSANDCLVLAGIHQVRKPDEALAWVERGLLLDKKKPYDSSASDGLAKLKRELLVRLGRPDVALAEAWAEFQKAPSKYRYEELMRFVPKAEVASWHAKALDAAEHGSLGSLIDLLVETQETERLIRCLREASDGTLEGLSHYVTEPAADFLAQTHPAVAAKLFRAMGLRILNAKKSKYYHEALENFEDAKNCYARAGLNHQWDAVVAQIRREHHRKVGFMPGFERLVAGRGPGQTLSYLDRARKRWLPPDS
jgi:tetratricopeptide (TPR) repeat protein